MSVIIFGIEGTELTPKEQQYLQQLNAAGVILFTRNYSSPSQLKNLCHSIRRTAPNALICVDHEGGRVQRFKSGFTRLPSAGAFGRVFDDRPMLANQLTEAAGLIAAYELRLYDIDFTFAPILDLQDAISSVIGERAYHESSAVVSELSQAFRRGLAHAGMAAVGKHFPGHGRVIGDSHHTLPYDERTLTQREADIFPFMRNIQTGIEGIMPAHILYPELDAKRPASFSPVLIQSLRALNFDGAIITDDLDMQGAHQFSDPISKVQTALDAGADCALICNNFADIEQTIKQDFHQQNKVQSSKRLQQLHAKDIALETLTPVYENALSLLNSHATQLH